MGRPLINVNWIWISSSWRKLSQYPLLLYIWQKKNSLMVPLTLRILSWLVWKFESRLPFCGNCIKKYVNIDSYDVYQWHTMNVLATFCATDFLEVWHGIFYVLFTTSLPFFRMILPSSKTVRSYFCDMLTPFHLKCFSLFISCTVPSKWKL